MRIENKVKRNFYYNTINKRSPLKIIEERKNLNNIEESSFQAVKYGNVFE
jgi:hypothetical protein